MNLVWISKDSTIIKVKELGENIDLVGRYLYENSVFELCEVYSFYIGKPSSLLEVDTLKSGIKDDGTYIALIEESVFEVGEEVTLIKKDVDVESYSEYSIKDALARDFSGFLAENKIRR